MKIYTRGGDKGRTGIHGGERVDKDDIRIEANGTLDEVNAEIGITVHYSRLNMNGKACWGKYKWR